MTRPLIIVGRWLQRHHYINGAGGSWVEHSQTVLGCCLAFTGLLWILYFWIIFSYIMKAITAYCKRFFLYCHVEGVKRFQHKQELMFYWRNLTLLHHKHPPWQVGGAASICSRSPRRHVRISLPTSEKPGWHLYLMMSPAGGREEALKGDAVKPLGDTFTCERAWGCCFRLSIHSAPVA